MGFLNGAIVTANVISQWVNNARTKKDIQRIYKDAAEANYTSRAVFAMPHLNKPQLLLTAVDTTEINDDVYLYDSKSTTPALDYIWGEHDNPESIVISGGKPDERNRAMTPFIQKSQQKGIPIIVLHTGNKNLEKVISGHGVACEFISSTGQYYDAFRSLPVDDMVFLLYEAMPDDIASPNAEALNGRTFAISHNDFVASLYGGEIKGDDMFVETTSGVNTIVLLNHKSGASCQKWSEYLGKYHKIKIKVNISQINSENRKKIPCTLRLTKKSLEWWKSLGEGYTSAMARMLEDAQNYPDILRKII